jgi:hypothetical protein
MPEHEPLDIASKDSQRRTKAEARGAGKADARSDDAAAASEPMDLQRLPESSAEVPPGRQRTGDPPARRRR